MSVSATISCGLRSRRRFRALAASALALAWLTVGYGAHAQEKALLWKVSKDAHSLYLLGSIHYLRKEHFPLHRSILETFEASKRLVLEIDLNSISPEVAQRATLEKAIYRDGSTLEQNVDPETYQLTAQAAEKLGLEIKRLAPMKPWFAALTLVALKLQRLGLEPGLGVDRYLAERARGAGKPTRGWESLEFPLALFDRLPRLDQQALLRETVGQMNRLDADIDQIVQSWTRGDSDRLETLLLAGMKEFPELHERVIVERNRRWVSQIEKMIAQGGGALVVVGAAHLVGKNGIVEMLKARGYRMEQV